MRRASLLMMGPFFDPSRKPFSFFCNPVFSIIKNHTLRKNFLILDFGQKTSVRDQFDLDVTYSSLENKIKLIPDIL